VANHGGKADDSRMPILNPPEIYASYTAQYVLITFLVAAGNLRKIDKFAREHRAPATRPPGTSGSDQLNQRKKCRRPPIFGGLLHLVEFCKLIPPVLQSTLGARGGT
jgi:hypothetical protein